MKTDVLISGAGPTGLLLANLLAELKISFRIVDEDEARAEESRAIAIQPKSMELLQKMGLIEEFLSRGLKANGITVMVGKKKAVQLNFKDLGRKDTAFSYIFFLSQSVTEQILEENLATKYGIKVERNSKLESFTQTSDSVSAVIAHTNGAKEEVAIQYLVGCDGARSQVRKSLGLGFEGGTYDAEFKLADATVTWDLPTDRVMLVLGDQNLVIFMPLQHDVSRIITISENKAETESVRKNLTTKTSGSIEEIQAKLQEASARPVTLTNPRWVTGYRVHHRSVEKMRVKRVFLAGDAAHIHSPAGGQGMNTGLQDAANLAWKLAHALQHPDSDDILQTYDSERMPIAKKLLQVTDRMFMVMASQNSLIKRLRNDVIPILGKYLMKTSFFRKTAFGFVSQLNIRYHPSKVVFENIQGESREDKIHAGNRAPDVRLGNGRNLFEFMKGYRFHLLVMSKEKMLDIDRKTLESNWQQKNLLNAGDCEILWLDTEQNPELLERYQIDEILITLVRPDGYIGFQSDRINF